MGLLEESGMLAKTEKILMRGKCRGKIPIKNVEPIISSSGKTFRIDLRPKVEWEDVDGEMVLTDRRLAVLKYGKGYEAGGQRNVLFYELNVVDIKAYKPLFQKAKLQLVLKSPISENESIRAELEVDNPEEWANAIKSNLILPELKERLSDDSKVRDLRDCLRKSLGEAGDWFSPLFWQEVKKFLQEMGADESERNKFKAAVVEELKSKGLDGVLGVTIGQLLSTYRSHDVKSFNETATVALEKIWFERKQAEKGECLS